ncbi:hypothetical protein Tco_0163004 [Tanacetum coccineum]
MLDSIRNLASHYRTVMFDDGHWLELIANLSKYQRSSESEMSICNVVYLRDKCDMFSVERNPNWLGGLIFSFLFFHKPTLAYCHLAKWFVGLVPRLLVVNDDVLPALTSILAEISIASFNVLSGSTILTGVATYHISGSVAKMSSCLNLDDGISNELVLMDDLWSIVNHDFVVEMNEHSVLSMLREEESQQFLVHMYKRTEKIQLLEMDAFGA